MQNAHIVERHNDDMLRWSNFRSLLNNNNVIIILDLFEHLSSGLELQIQVVPTAHKPTPKRPFLLWLMLHCRSGYRSSILYLADNAAVVRSNMVVSSSGQSGRSGMRRSNHGIFMPQFDVWAVCTVSVISSVDSFSDLPCQDYRLIVTAGIWGNGITSAPGRVNEIWQWFLIIIYMNSNGHHIHAVM